MLRKPHDIIDVRNKLKRKNTVLFWLTDETSMEVKTASQTLPEWSPHYCLPCSSGIISLYDNVTEECDIILAWQVVEDNAIKVDGCVYHRGEIATAVSRLVYEGETIPAYVSTWQGLSQSDFLRKLNSPEVVRAAQDSLIALLGASWTFLNDLKLTERTPRRVTANPMAAHKKKRKHKPETVQIINLRREIYEHHQRSGGGSDREFQCRWFVKGHWRQQRVGPGRKQRKPVYIAPYIKGPADKPLKTERILKA